MSDLRKELEKLVEKWPHTSVREKGGYCDAIDCVRCELRALLDAQPRFTIIPNSEPWAGWPRESWDDAACQCDSLDNHTHCPVHGLNTSTGRFRTAEEWIANQKELLDAQPTPASDGELVSLVDRFAAALLEKLRAAATKYGYNNDWMKTDWMDECRAKLRHHLEKGDPRDVAAYCAFLWHHGESTTSTATTPADEVMVKRMLESHGQGQEDGLREACVALGIDASGTWNEMLNRISHYARFGFSRSSK